MKTFLFDTSIFNCIVNYEDTEMLLSHIERLLELADIEICTTYDVLHQLEGTKDKRRRNALLEIQQRISKVIPSQTTVVNITKVNEGRLGNGEEMYQIRGKSKDIVDALIAEVGQEVDIFVSDDKDQRKRAARVLSSESIIDFSKFISELYYG